MIQKFTLVTDQHFRLLLLILLAALHLDVSGQEDKFPAGSPKLLNVESRNDIRLTLSPQEHNLLGLFVGYDTTIAGINVSSRNEFSVWVDGKLFAPEKNKHQLSIDELLGSYRGRDTVFVVFYARSNFKNFQCAYIESSGTEEEIQVNPIKLRSAMDSRHTFAIFFLFFLLIVAFFRYLSSYGFFSYFNKVFFRSLRVSTFDENSQTILFETIITSLLTGMAMWHIFDGKSVYLPNFFIEQSGNMLKYSGFAALFLTGKYLVLRLSAYLNGLRSLYMVQFTDFLKFLLMCGIILNTIFFSLYWLDSSPANYLSDNWVYFYPTAYLLFISYYFFKLSASVPGKKLLIISYLCSTEIVGAYIVASILIN